MALFCDEAQRQSRNSYEWLRDVHDQLAYHGIRLITFLIGQPQLLAQKAGFQMSGDEQIVARFMIEQMLFHGIRDAGEAATCLAGYDKTRYPEGSGPNFTGYFLAKSFAAGLRLEHSGADLWNAFVRAHVQDFLCWGPPSFLGRRPPDFLSSGPPDFLSWGPPAERFLKRPEGARGPPMAVFPLIFLGAATAVATVVAARYSRLPESMRLPSWVHTKELTIWGYAA